MSRVAVIICAVKHQPDTAESLSASLAASPLLGDVIIAGAAAAAVRDEPPTSGRCIARALELAGAAEHVLFVTAPSPVDMTPEELERFAAAARRVDSGLCYADYYCGERDPLHVVPVIDYQEGSIRDDFFFGPVQLFSLRHIRAALERTGPLSATSGAGLYELRLKVSLAAAVARVPEPLCRVSGSLQGKAAHFAYVEPGRLAFQKELEQVATDHLKRIGAYCAHELQSVAPDPAAYPVTASVVIPVRNREATIAEAITSALGQRADFPFNVLVVQNHSTDATGRVVEKLARQDARVIQIVPDRTDLGIGGCWNAAVASPHCGRSVCQLDSDDLYEGEDALASMISALQDGACGMAVGAYRVVDAALQEIPPGIVDHREWSAENGRNNLLRVQGVGAPRAFPAALLRRHPFPDVSYGEDYAVALRISRDYPVGRIYRPLYLCRRWEHNTDANLTTLEENRLAFLKDTIRTHEIQERQQLNERLKR